MKNIYTSLLMGSALLLAGSSMAQSHVKEGQSLSHGIQTLRPISHPTTMGNAQRGGAPANDDCSGSITQSLSVGSTVTFTGDNTGATLDDGLDIPCVWESFTTTECTNLALTYCGTSPAFGNAYLSLFIGCPFTDYLGAADYDVTTCPDGNVTIFYEAVPAGTYYYAVMADPDNGAVGAYTITVGATAAFCPTPPANDECAGAISLTSAATCNITYFNTIAATASMPAITCGGYTSPTSNDVWFSFICTNAEQTISVEGFNASDAVIELFSGSCGSLTSLGCADDTYPAAADETTMEVLDQTGLTVGSTYYFRVYDWGELSGTNIFAACVTEGSGNTIGISEQQKPAALSIYPNPGSGDFNLQYTGTDGLANIEVFDLTGRTVYSEQAHLASGSTHTLDLGNLAQGQYSLRLTVNGVRSQQNLMVR